MKLLTKEERNQVSGGVQYLVVDSQIEFEGIPSHCVESFFLANQNNLSSFNTDDIGWNIIKHCTEFDNVSSYSFSFDVMPISMSLVSL